MLLSHLVQSRSDKMIDIDSEDIAAVETELHLIFDETRKK